MKASNFIKKKSDDKDDKDDKKNPKANKLIEWIASRKGKK